MTFREFLVESDLKDVKDTLKRVPKRHAALIRGYNFEFQSGNTMKRDGDHIGMIDDKKKKITLAAPYYYGREFVLLHELGHKVWATLSKEQQKKWKSISKGTKNKSEEGAEETFAMAYAREYANDLPGDYHDHASWHKFIKSI